MVVTHSDRSGAGGVGDWRKLRVQSQTGAAVFAGPGWFNRRGYRESLALVTAWALVRLLLLPIIDPVLMRGDDVDYVAAARQLVENGSIDRGARPPGYPAFLAATLWLGPAGVFAVQSALILAAAFFTRARLGFWPALAIAACPFFVFFEWSLYSEALAIVLLWCAWLLAFFPRRRWDFALGALLCGLAIITRDILLLLPLTVLCARLDWRKTALFLALAWLPYGLWSTQPHQSHFGFNLWIGTWERDPDWKLHSIRDWPDYAFTQPGQKERLTRAFGSDDRAFLDVAIDRYRTDPESVVKAWAERYRYLWIGTRTELTNLTLARYSVAWYVFKSFMFALNSAMLALGLVGAAIAIRRRDRQAVLALPIAYTALIYVPFHNTELRYSLVAVPFLLVLGVHACRTLLRSSAVWRGIIRSPPSAPRS